MFKFVRKHSQPIGDHPLTDTLFFYIAWKYRPSQPIGDHPLWQCPLRVVSNFVRHSHIYIYIYIFNIIYTYYIHILHLRTCIVTNWNTVQEITMCESNRIQLHRKFGVCSGKLHWEEWLRSPFVRRKRMCEEETKWLSVEIINYGLWFGGYTYSEMAKNKSKQCQPICGKFNISDGCSIVWRQTSWRVT